MWPLWWHLGKAWFGPALLEMLPGRGVARLTLGKMSSIPLHPPPAEDVVTLELGGDEYAAVQYDEVDKVFGHTSQSNSDPRTRRRSEPRTRRYWRKWMQQAGVTG